MKTTLKGLKKDEKGAALVITVVLLLIGSLILAPLLAHMGTGQLAGQVHEKRMGELYAADAGVEYTMWNMIHEWDVPNLSKCEEIGWGDEVDPFELDGRNVTANAEFVGKDPEDPSKGIFRITANVWQPETDDDPATLLTTVVAYVKAHEDPPLDFSSMLDYAIVSGGDIDLEGDGRAASQVWGNVYLPDEKDLKGREKINGTVYDKVNDGVEVAWPTAEQLRAYYWKQVEDSGVQPYPAGTVIDVSGRTKDAPYIIEASYAEGSLTIQGDGWVRFDGPLYVKGESSVLSVKANPILNGETMFSEGEIDVKPHTSVYGSGCVIAVGKVFLMPGVHTHPDDYVLVLSLEDEARILPTVPPRQGHGFFGTVAGKTLVKTLPHVTVTWPEDVEKLVNFPTGGDEGEASWKGFRVANYIIDPDSP